MSKPLKAAYRNLSEAERRAFESGIKIDMGRSTTQYSTRPDGTGLEPDSRPKRPAGLVIGDEMDTKWPHPSLVYLRKRGLVENPSRTYGIFNVHSEPSKEFRFIAYVPASEHRSSLDYIKGV